MGEGTRETSETLPEHAQYNHVWVLALKKTQEGRLSDHEIVNGVLNLFGHLST